jgi:hypothetical protein
MSGIAWRIGQAFLFWETYEKGCDTDDVSSVVRLREDEAGVKARYAGRV